jgi:hypothetical protein
MGGMGGLDGMPEGIEDMSEDELGDHYDQMQGGGTGITFMLEVKNSNGGETMFMEVLGGTHGGEGGGVDIQSLKIGDKEKDYTGPELHELDPEFQQSLTDFVEGVCGIDAQTVEFMMINGEEVEKKQYGKWLAGLKKIIE